MTSVTTGRILLAVTAALAVASVTAGSHLEPAAVAGSPRALRPGTVIQPASYHLDESLPAMLTHPTNADLVVGTVTGVESARWNTPDGGPPQTGELGLFYVFTPVQVTVTAVLRGESARAGSTIVVRRYDGSVGDVTSVPEEGRSCALQPGNAVVLFLQAPHQLNDGRTDRIANAAYAVNADGVLVATDGTAYGTLATLQALVESGEVAAPTAEYDSHLDLDVEGTDLPEGCG